MKKIKNFTKLLLAVIIAMNLALPIASAAGHNHLIKSATSDYLFSDGEAPCTIIQFPYVVNFDDSTTLPGCLTTYTTQHVPSIQTMYYSSAPNALILSVSSGNQAMLVLPALTEEISWEEARLNFRAQSGDLQGLFQVVAIHDINNPGEYTVVSTITFSKGYYWETKKLDLLGVPDSCRYIGFRWGNTTGGSYSSKSVIIDDIELGYTPDCVDISGLTTKDIGPTHVALQWEAEYGEYDYFEAQYAELGSGEWVDIYDVDTTSYFLSYLEGSTRYQFRVRLSCNDEYLDWHTINFQTDCGATSLLHEIDSGADKIKLNSRYMPFWAEKKSMYTQQIYTHDELGNKAMTISSIAWNYVHENTLERKLTIYMGHRDTNEFAYNKWHPDTLLTEVFSGKLTFNRNNNNWFTIPIDNFEYNGTQNLVIAVVSSGEGGGGYLTSDVFFNTYPSDKKVVVFAHGTAPYDVSNPGNMSGWPSGNNRNNIRFFSCSDSPCYGPIQIHTEVAVEEATISWQEIDYGTTFELEYKELAAADWISEGSFAATTITIEGLSESTDYTGRIRTLCENDTTQWQVFNFTTLCAKIYIPYSEKFDQITGVDYPTCWGRETTLGTRLPVLVNNEGTDARKAISFGDIPNAANYVILPEFEEFLSLANCQINFSAKVTGNNGVLTLGFLNERNNIYSYTVFDTVRFSAAEINNWLEFEYPFANTDMATSNLAFRWENGDGSSALIDDIFVDYAASCPRPLRVEIDSVSANSAKISWEERGVATSWEVEYLPIGGSVGSGNKVWATTAPTAVITDLDALTNYEVYIRAICAGGDTSEYSTAISFVTLQSVATLPYLCDFEDDTENALWDLENGNQINKWYIDTIVHNQIVESKGLYISDDGGATNHFFQTRNSSTWAFRDIQLPEEADGEFVLSFDWRAFGYTDHMFGTHQDYLSVYIGPIATVESGNTQAPAGSTTLFNALNESDQWVRGETVIPLTFGGEMVRLYFLWRNSGSSFGQQPPAAVDNISIFHTTCIPPTSIQVNAENITDSSAVITWTRDENNSWILEYKNVDSVQWSSIQVDTDTTYLANQLTDGATYEVRVKTVCSDDNSRYISTTFETPEAPEIPELCIEPTNLAVTIITQNSAHIAWTAGGKETSWKLSYKAETGDTYTDSTLTTTTFDLENLAPATTYEVLVWAICAEGEQSDSVFATFTTENEPVILYNITATAGSNGRIEPSGTFTVEAGSDTMFVITPDKDYIIESIVINSAGAPIQDTIRLENINEDYTIQVEFVTNSISKHNTHDITIYPNPAKDLLNVKLDRQFDNVVVYNLLGEKVAYQTITDMNITIRVASFAPGIYFARFQNSKETVNIKFVKE